MARIVFYCRDARANLDLFEYYRQDIEALADLGHEVVICTRYREIPLRFDAIFVWWWTYALVPALIARLRGRPCLITAVYNFRNSPHFKGADYFRRPVLQRFAISAATRLATLNLFIDENELRDCTKYFGLSTARYYPCIVSDDYLQGPGPEREVVIFNLAWSGKGNLIRKGIPDLLRAVRLLKDEGMRVRLNLAGQRGDGEGFLQDMIEELDLSGEVRLLGPLSRSDKIEMLRKCEIYAQPSHHEGFGLATAEAMGSGACVVTCDVGAVRAVVGECGIYVAPESPVDLAAALRNAVTDGDLRKRFQTCALERARTQFAAGRKLDRLREYLAECGIR